MSDPFAEFSDTAISPATRAIAVIPDDGAALPVLPKALYIGTGGIVVARGAADETDSVWHNVPDGTILPFRAAFVRSSGTTAADILALV